ncbi:hypothetical protein TNCV_4973631 [Trichonephila clavipes]|uniref:Uncharacterized protein n=1 Tax=Trichonephila clavipes TaxID=2585209 RepID=A0A8X6SI48_TRICX|nr:hypothetical protein TNCV_4973631 [Trichonephila clavipes]
MKRLTMESDETFSLERNDFVERMCLPMKPVAISQFPQGICCNLQFPRNLMKQLAMPPRNLMKQLAMPQSLNTLRSPASYNCIMIEIYKSHGWYFLIVPNVAFPTFVENYVLPCRVGTHLKFHGFPLAFFTDAPCVLNVQFERTEAGFFCKHNPIL